MVSSAVERAPSLNDIQALLDCGVDPADIYTPDVLDALAPNSPTEKDAQTTPASTKGSTAKGPVYVYFVTDEGVSRIKKGCIFDAKRLKERFGTEIEDTDPCYGEEQFHHLAERDEDQDECGSIVAVCRRHHDEIHQQERESIQKYGVEVRGDEPFDLKLTRKERKTREKKRSQERSFKELASKTRDEDIPKGPMRYHNQNGGINNAYFQAAAEQEARAAAQEARATGQKSRFDFSQDVPLNDGVGQSRGFNEDTDRQIKQAHKEIVVYSAQANGNRRSRYVTSFS